MQALANTTVNLGVPWKLGNSLASSTAVGFSCLWCM